MQINASYLNSLTASLQQISSNEQALTTEISSGSRIAAISDDPAASAMSVMLSASLQADDSYHNAVQSVTGRLQVTDSTLGGVISQLTQAITVATAGSNGTNNASDLSSAATQLSGIRDEILALANTSYRGSYLFSGSQTSTTAFTLNDTTDPAITTYQGDTMISSLQSPSGSRIPLNLPGNQIFAASSSDVFGTLNQLIADFKNGNVSGAQAGTAKLSGDVSYISQQRVTIDNSITRLSAQDAVQQQQSTQLLVEQTNLMQANTAAVATALSSSETQQAALQDAIAALEKQGTLFSVLAG